MYRIIAIPLLLIAAIYCGWQVHHLSLEQKAIKTDYSDVNNISFGILSVNKWRDYALSAVRAKISDFNLTKAERDSLEKAIENVLYAMIDKADSLIKAPQHTIGGKIRKLAYKTFVNDKKLKEQVPGFSQKIVQEAIRPRNKNKLAYLAKSKLENLSQDTYDSARESEEKQLDSVYQKYGVSDGDHFNKKTTVDLAVIHEKMKQYAFIQLGIVLIVLLHWYLLRNTRPVFVPLYILSILIALVLLVTGLTSIMIEVDARINALSFQLLGETVTFKDQVIFFQSKSIVDVVTLLIKTGKYDSIAVGVLILCFSIFFPITKLLSTGVYLLGKRGWTKGRFIHYFAFHSGKWSMADVMVVAIFMAYIGFNSILNDQMKYLNFRKDTFTSIATNQTSLQPGYLVFVGFVLFGLALSEILKRITKDDGKDGKQAVA